MKKLFSTLLALSMILSMLTTGAVFAASDAVQADADALTVEDILSVPAWSGNMLIDNLDLDCYTKGEVNESPVSWASSDPAIITAAGKVTRGSADAEVTITATIGEGDDVVTKDFVFVVPAASKSVNGMPTVSTLKYEDDFSDAVINTSRLSSGSIKETDSIAEANGKLTLTRSEFRYDGSEPYMEINYEYNGNLSTTIEMTLHSTSSYVRIPFIGYNWNGYPLYIHWYPYHNNISIGVNGVRDDSVEAGRIPLPQSAIGGKAKFTITINAKSKTYDIWVNNELVLAGQAYLQSNAQKPYKVRVVTVTSDWMYGVGSIAMDNLRIYESTDTPSFTTMKNVDKNMSSALTYSKNAKTYLVGEFVDLSLTTDTNGSSVSYVTSDASVISETGKVTRALVDKEVTIAATITATDGGTMVKNYKFVVPGKYNKIGKDVMPLVDVDYPVNYTVTANKGGVSDNSILTDFSEINGKIAFKSAYTSTSTSEPGFTYKYSDNLKADFVQDFVFSSNSNAMRARVSDSAYNRKLDVYYLDNGTLAVSGASGTVEYHAEKFTGKIIKLTLVYSMNTSSVDIYVNGTLWLDDYAIKSDGHKNIQHVMVSHHCATILGTWRGGQGTTTFYSLNAYKIADETALSSVMKSEPVFSNEGTVVSGKNTVTVPIVATDDAGAIAGGVLIYAIYGVEKDTYSLEAIDVVPMSLDKYAHKEYTASVNLDEVPANAVQKVFVWNGTDTITPVKAEAFPN